MPGIAYSSLQITLRSSSRQSDNLTFFLFSFGDPKYRHKEKKSLIPWIRLPWLGMGTRKEENMNSTKKFYAGSEWLDRENGNYPNYHIVGGDFGNSANKTWGPHGMSRFPSFAVRMGRFWEILDLTPSTIQLEDLVSGDVWLLGEKAQAQLSAGIRSVSEQEQYSRYRWRSPWFRALVMASLGSSFKDKGEQRKRIILQTALPDGEMHEDRSEFRDVLSGHFHFRLKRGDSDFREYDFEIRREDISVMKQSKATVFSACMDSAMIHTPDSDRIISKKTMIMDGGFGALNVCPYIGGTFLQGSIYRDLGMKRILHDTCERFYAKYGVHVPVPAMQSHLEEGMISIPDRKKGRYATRKQPFGDILEEVSKNICLEALERIKQSSSFGAFNTLILGGGTCAAWEDYIRAMLSQYKGLTIISAGRNVNVSPVFSVSRGLFEYRYLKLLYGRA